MLRLNRRDFLTLIAAGLATACTRSPTAALPPGALLGPDAARGHRLRKGVALNGPTRQKRTRTLIVGAGVAGLSAAFTLDARGQPDYALLELEDHVGGNSHSAPHHSNPHPWGAHYLPLPSADYPELAELLQALGLVTGRDAQGAPVYDERHLLHPPGERLFQQGRWRSGLRPLGSASSVAEFARFDALIHTLSTARDAQGAPAFAIPTARSSRAAQWLDLDALSFEQWLSQQALHSPELRWFAEYGCRDDYGGTLRAVSAWAGLHYHAARRPWGDYSEDTVLTWPQGNGWLVQQLARPLGERLHTGRTVLQVQQSERSVTVEVLDAQGVHEQWQCEQLILCTPSFVRQRLLPQAPSAPRRHPPWLVANLHLSDWPAKNMAWDNVLYDSPGLGYVAANHQNLALPQGRGSELVITYYLPFAGDTAADDARARQLLYAASREHWAQFVLDDLARAHPDLHAHVQRLDVWRWGHGMVCPTPGLRTHPAFLAEQQAQGRVRFAHSDLSGISLFEEAYWWGRAAALAV